MTSPSFYSPRTPSAIDTIGYTQRVVDSILRNNPLHNAAIESGLMKWFGNYTDDDGSKRNFLWIGEFLPADTNLPGDPPQRGFSMVRDDSRGTAAFNLYDPFPSTGDGLKQRLALLSGDGHGLMIESRQGGWNYPQAPIPMGHRDSDLSLWPGTDSGSFSGIYEGQMTLTGRDIAYRMWDACTGGATGQFRLRVEGSVSLTSAVHTLPANGNGVVDSSMDVSAMRGETVTVYWEAARTNGVGKARASLISIRNFTIEV